MKGLKSITDQSQAICPCQTQHLLGKLHRQENAWLRRHFPHIQAQNYVLRYGLPVSEN